MNPADRTLYTGPHGDGSLPYWRTPTLWKGAQGLPVFEVSIEELNVLDEVVWFGGHKDVKPTVRSVAEHAKDIFNADLDCPIIIMKARDGPIYRRHPIKCEPGSIDLNPAVLRDSSAPFTPR